ncbi:hypothetical protein EJD97_011085 [Solanum chilense]|uniref:Uncharacterized protein n=1 Tax=Solanum chilense TaxID=4083 RepID=A0A6N2BJS3_SOLCI|nr:hypothetical protein EJD97_011085 [Solanum chilense]
MQFVSHPPKNEISGTLSITKSDNKIHSSKRKRLEWKTISHETELCPDAVSECNDNYMSNHRSLESLQELKEHLSYLGWKIEQAKDYNIIRTRYVAPDGKIFQSLRKVCKMLENSETREEGQKTSYDGSSDDLNLYTCLAKSQTCNEVFELQYTSQAPLVPPEYCPEAVIDYCLLGSPDDPAYKKLNSGEKKSMIMKAKKHLAAIGWIFSYCQKGDRRELRYCPPHGRKKFISLRTACIWCMQQWKAEGQMPELVSRSNVLELQGNLAPHRTSCKKLSMVTFSALPLWKEPTQLNKVTVCEISETRKKSNHAVLSWLIDNNMVLPRAKVQYRVKKDGRPMAEGWITRAGIKCKCCQKVYGISNFEVHAGSSYHRPSANIFLEDGRSLLDCQLQMKEKSIVRNTRKRSPLLKKRSHLGTNDNEVPDGEWFCPSCCCEMCGQSRFDKNKDHFTDNSLLICCQCEHKYHARCMRDKGLQKLDCYPVGKWFCNKRYEQICLGIHQLLAKPVIKGIDNLTWTLLKYVKPDDFDSDAAKDEFVLETYSKLGVALDVMNECFEPVEEPYTRRDLMEDVIFNRWSELNRLNFQGFYTVLLERNDEVITVANVRIYGEKVAEVPLVATRFQYCRLGMCHILMNELETNVSETPPEYPSREAYQPQLDHKKSKETVELDGNSALSEVFQAEQLEGSEIVGQGYADAPGGCESNDMDAPTPLITVANQQAPLGCQDETSLQYQAEVTDSNVLEKTVVVQYKCYKRRKKILQ